MKFWLLIFLFGKIPMEMIRNSFEFRSAAGIAVAWQSDGVHSMTIPLWLIGIPHESVTDEKSLLKAEPSG